MLGFYCFWGTSKTPQFCGTICGTRKIEKPKLLDISRLYGFRELMSGDELIEDLWTNGMYIDGNTLYVNIGRLREKLSQIGATDFIRTVRGVGYRL